MSQIARGSGGEVTWVLRSVTFCRVDGRYVVQYEEQHYLLNLLKGNFMLHRSQTTIWRVFAFISISVMTACGGSGGGSQNPVALKFKAVDNGKDVSCESVLTGFGPDGGTTVGVSDLRFYVSNLKFYDASSKELSSELVANDFQLIDSSGSVALIDLTSNVNGSCSNSTIAFGEGTERTNNQVAALVEEGTIASVSFDVGVPQKMMKEVVSTYSAEDAPSPLGEMYWSWASGYRHFVFNFTIKDKNNKNGEGYLHLGSRDCGGDGAVALTDRESCGFVNTPSVVLNGFDPNTKTVTVDIAQALKGLSFVTEVYESSPPYNPIGRGPGVACHSAPPEAQPDCSPIFSNFGLDTATGNAVVSNNSVFSSQ